jgi:hypothetical protein
MSIDLTLRTSADSNVVALIERLELGESSGQEPVAIPQPPNRTPVRTREQSLALPAVMDTVRGWSRKEGFVGAVVLASRDHNRITVYSQFEPGMSDDAQPALRVLDSIDALGIPARTLDRRTYDLMWRDGNEALTGVSPLHTPVVHFGLFTVLDDQADALLEKVESTAPASLVTPGLRTINFHRSHDRQRVINFGTWSTFEHFHVLHEQPGFTTGEKYWQGLATFENDYFDVIDVIGKNTTADEELPG